MRDFWLPEAVEQTAISDSIRSALNCVEEAETETRSRYLDSFDWGLYRAGAALIEQTAGEHRELVWLDLGDGGAIVARQPLKDDPGFIDAVPPGPVRSLLEPLLGIRRLLPMASVGDIPSVPGELFAKFQTSFYTEPVDAVFKALGVE